MLSDNVKKELVQTVINFLKGSSLFRINIELSSLVDDLERNCLKKNCRDLYREISLDDTINQHIFTYLNITNTEEINRVLSKSANLYELICNLNHAGYHHFNYLINQIDKTNPKGSYSLFFVAGAGTAAGVGSFFYCNPTQLESFSNWVTHTWPTLWDWAIRSLLSARYIPLFGLAYHSLDLLYHWHTTFKHDTIPINEIFHLMLKTLGKSLIIAANTLSYIARGLITRPIAILFMVGFAIDIVDQLYQLSVLYFFTTTKPRNTGTCYERAAGEREYNFLERKKYELGCRLSASLLISASIFVLYLFPPSLVISISTFIFGWCVALTCSALIEQINQQANTQLQNKLTLIFQSENVSSSPAARSEEENNLVTENNRLREENEQLKRTISEREGCIRGLETSFSISVHQFTGRLFPAAVPSNEAEINPSTSLVVPTAPIEVPDEDEGEDSRLQA